MVISDLALGRFLPQRKEASAENPTDGPLSRNGILDDFDFDDHEGPRIQTHTETVPFMALDFLNEEGRGGTPRRYRHEAEAFVWTLIYRLRPRGKDRRC